MPKKREAQQARLEQPQPSRKQAQRSKPQQERKSLEVEFMQEKIDQQVNDIVTSCKEQVKLKVKLFMDDKRQEAQSLRAKAGAVIAKIQKRIRTMSAVDFFELTPEEAAASTLNNVMQRMHVLKHGNDACMDALVGAGTIVPLLADADGPSISLQEKQQPQPESGQTELHQADAEVAAPQMEKVAQGQAQKGKKRTRTVKLKQEKQQGRGQEQLCKSSAQDLAVSPSKRSRATALVPPPAVRLPLGAANLQPRRPEANEVLYSANGSPVHVAVGAGRPMLALKGRTGRRAASGSLAAPPLP